MPRTKKEKTEKKTSSTAKKTTGKGLKLTTVEEKLYVNKIKPDFNSHLKVNNDICRTCYGKECTKFCPSNVFTWNDEDQKLIVAYENCLECGACISGCPFENVVYGAPRAGYGQLK